jgi:glycosyltransferase involved in cell wall biosynthesis
MRIWRRLGGRTGLPSLGVVVPAYQVEDYLAPCLDSVLAQTHRDLDVVVVDDGATDRTGEIADGYARRESRVRVVHTANHGLGAARNEGIRHIHAEYVAFVDSDDVVPATAYAGLVGRLAETGSDFVSASFVRWEADGLHEPPWMRRLHREERQGITAEDHPELLGDVFAWDKVFRRSFWERAGLSWPEGIRYEDQPCTTEAFLRGRFDVVPDISYHWRIRGDGSSITQQRASVTDLLDRLETKRMALASVRAEASTAVAGVFVDRVLAGDMWRYFTEIPGAPDEWWELLVAGVRELWGERSLVHSGLTPAHRLIGWLVEQDRRADAAALATWLADHPGQGLPRAAGPGGRPRLGLPVPGIDPASVDPAALALRDHELAGQLGGHQLGGHQR